MIALPRDADACSSGRTHTRSETVGNLACVLFYFSNKKQELQPSSLTIHLPLTAGRILKRLQLHRELINYDEQMKLGVIIESSLRPISV